MMPKPKPLWETRFDTLRDRGVTYETAKLVYEWLDASHAFGYERTAASAWNSLNRAYGIDPNTDEDAREVFATFLPDDAMAGGWGVPTALEDDGWDEKRYRKALARLRELVGYA